MFRNNTYCRKSLFKKKLIDSPTCLYCDTDEDLYHRLYSCFKSKLIWRIANNILDLANMPPIFEAEVFLTNYENSTLTPYNQIILYTRWFIDQARTLENSPNALSYPSALFNVLSEVQKSIRKKTPLFKEYEDILNAIFHFRQNQDPQNLNSRVS